MKTVGEHLREIFLRGEEVRGHEVAKQLGTTNSTVSKALKAFGAMVEARQEKLGFSGRYGQEDLEMRRHPWHVQLARAEHRGRQDKAGD